MKVNFRPMDCNIDVKELEEHAIYLASIEHNGPGELYGRTAPEGYENYVCVDVLGEEFAWMNESFSKEKFTWYLWFESVFLVPEEMATYLTLKWS